MTPERERQIRETLSGHETCSRAECQAWRAAVTDVLGELTRVGDSLEVGSEPFDEPEGDKLSERELNAPRR